MFWCRAARSEDEALGALDEANLNLRELERELLDSRRCRIAKPVESAKALSSCETMNEAIVLTGP